MRAAGCGYVCADANIGVAVSDSPTGPFKDALGEPLLKGGDFRGQMIDPAVFTDDDGKQYLYGGNGRACVVPLGDDMTSVDTERVITSPAGASPAAPRLTGTAAFTLGAESGYAFRVTVTDDPDTFRIKIWKKSTGEVLEDNRTGARSKGVVTIGHFR